MIALAARAHANEHAPTRVELAACLADTDGQIARAVQVELGQDEAPPGDPAVVVRVDCAREGRDAGVVIEVHPPGAQRQYRYALDWHSQPEDARPRLLGLAVAEAVEASRIELVAVAEPRAEVAPPAAPIVAPRSRWTVASIVDRRAFSARAGLALLGLGIAANHELAPHLYAGADLVAEGATVLTSSGAISAVAISAAPAVAFRIGGRSYAELGLGVRVGLVRMRGEALPGSELVGTTQVRAWCAPAATLAAGIRIAPAITARAQLELGAVATGATARDHSAPVGVIGGISSAVGVGVAIAL